MQLSIRLSLALPLFAFAATGAHASVTRFDSAAAFDAATTDRTNYGFDGLAPDASFAKGSVTVGGVTFGSSGTAYVIDDGYNANYGAAFFSGQSSNDDPSVVLVATAGTHAIGFDFGSYISTTGSPVTIRLNTGETFLESVAAPGQTAFIGFLSSTPIDSISFTTIDNENNTVTNGFSMDITRFTVAAPVPEPATYATMLAGLALLAGIARRRSQRRH
ncbi:hypothetical protein BH11PSE9_BH11PSE9_02630 [soil metagenome]